MLLVYLPLLLATVVLESAVIAGLTKRGHRRRAIAACLALNCVTHPIFTLLSWNGHLDFPLVEIFVTAFEAIGYSAILPTSGRRALGVSIAANLLSAALGYVLSMG
jgi:hypothetical protein